MENNVHLVWYKKKPGFIYMVDETWPFTFETPLSHSQAIVIVCTTLYAISYKSGGGGCGIVVRAYMEQTDLIHR